MYPTENILEIARAREGWTNGFKIGGARKSHRPMDAPMPPATKANMKLF